MLVHTLHRSFANVHISHNQAHITINQHHTHIKRFALPVLLNFKPSAQKIKHTHNLCIQRMHTHKRNECKMIYASLIKNDYKTRKTTDEKVYLLFVCLPRHFDFTPPNISIMIAKIGNAFFL